MRKHSDQTRQVLAALLSAEDETYGYQLVKATGLTSGSVYPILRRLEDRAIVTTRQELVTDGFGVPRIRVYYRLTDDGRRQATGTEVVAT